MVFGLVKTLQKPCPMNQNQWQTLRDVQPQYTIWSIRHMRQPKGVELKGGNQRKTSQLLKRRSKKIQANLQKRFIFAEISWKRETWFDIILRKNWFKEAGNIWSISACSHWIETTGFGLWKQKWRTCAFGYRAGKWDLIPTVIWDTFYSWWSTEKMSVHLWSDPSRMDVNTRSEKGQCLGATVWCLQHLLPDLFNFEATTGSLKSKITTQHPQWRENSWPLICVKGKAASYDIHMCHMTPWMFRVWFEKLVSQSLPQTILSVVDRIKQTVRGMRGTQRFWRWGHCGYLWIHRAVHGGRLRCCVPVGVGRLGARRHWRLRRFGLSCLRRTLDVLPVSLISLRRTHAQMRDVHV